MPHFAPFRARNLALRAGPALSVGWVLGLCLGVSFSMPLGAHPGHDHDAGPAPAVAVMPRAESYSDRLELLVMLDGSDLLIFLDDFATNAPILAADVLVETRTPQGLEEFQVHDEGDGVYRLSAPWLTEPGRHDVLVSVQDDAGFDLLIARLEIPEPERPQTLTTSWSNEDLGAPVGVLALVFLIGLGAGMGLRRRRPIPPLAHATNRHQDVGERP